ncbi:ferritin-like domain-containing protein [Methylobacter svalbardensis]|uniref:ferritin-like domain-containing protein n=1 Tax=Methylobacter svalbardensis TaxID=3080016 RepID=UPI0030EE87FF
MNNLTETEIRALNEALDDEYRSFATYDQVIADFGEVPPFSNISEAERRHIDALCVLFARYGLPVPENPWPGKVDRYASLQEACEAGVVAEIANAEIYERLLQATERQDILTVFRNLHEASQQRHLPAFQRCAQGSAGRGGHGGRERRQGKHGGGHE